MSTFLQSMDLSIWMFIQTKWTKPTSPEGEWTKAHHKAHLSNYKVLNVIFCAVSPTEFRRICNLIVVKNAWELLQVNHERTRIIKKSKLQMLPSRFEELRMEDDEQFIDFYTKLQDIVHGKAGLGKPIEPADVIRKILRSLPKRFRTKVTTIEESKDIDTIVIEELDGSLQTFEMTFRKNTKKKGIALKVEE